MKGPDSQRMVDRLKQDLNLTTEQVTQVQIILKDQQAQMDAFRKASKDKLVQMLTAEQATKFQTLESDRKQRMQQNIQEMQQRLERM
jgi:Spy/CpxP family protein refolding chaperone